MYTKIPGLGEGPYTAGGVNWRHWSTAHVLQSRNTQGSKAHFYNLLTDYGTAPAAGAGTSHTFALCVC